MTISGQIDLDWRDETRGGHGEWTRTRFRETYPPGLHDVPVEHLKALRTHGLFHPIDGLTEEVRKDGVRQPIDVAQEFTPWNHAHTASIADGVHRLAVAERLGLKTVPVHVWSEEEQATQSARFRAAGYRGPATPWDALRQQNQEHSISGQLPGNIVDLDWHNETRGQHGEWISNPTAAQWAAIDAARGGYNVPDHSRLLSERSPYKDPADHPFFQRNPVSAANIANAWDASSDEDKAQGMRWYHDANLIAQAISPDDTEKGAGLLSAYSPQTSWPVNMMNATRAMREGRAIGPGEGMITGQMQKTAQRIMDGAKIDEALKSPKTNAFAHLILHGTDPPGEKLGKVVIDRHALSVAVGRRLSRDDIDDSPIAKDRFYEHVADQYRLAAKAISAREGRTISPHQVQAATWLHQQEMNQDADASGGEGSGGAALGKGRTTMGQKAWEHWADTSEGMPVHVGTTLDKVAEPITASDIADPNRPTEVRGNSRSVSPEEFQRLAADGRGQLRTMRKNRAPITGLDKNWPKIKTDTFKEVQASWGGATIDAHTGEPLPQGADKYALSVKPAGLSTVSVPEKASQADFDAAMDRARAQFREQLEAQQSYLGVFHDDDNSRIDIDPVTVVSTPAEVEQIGAYTHAIGGAYHFATGDGYFPPHVGVQMSSDGSATGVRFKGPGHWRSQADQLQPGLSPAQVADLDDDQEAGRTISSQIQS